MTTQEATSKIAQQSSADLIDTKEFLRKKLDVSNFEALLKNANKHIANEADLKSANKATLATQIDQLKAYAEVNGSDAIANANKNLLLPESDIETWTAGPGDFSIASTYKWAIGGGIIFPGEAPLSFLVGGTGGSWQAWATGTTVTFGTFVVDPQKIVLSREFHEENSPIGRIRKGPCKFTASGGGAGVSGITISFYSMDGTFWGTLTGTGALIGYFSVEGELDLVWQGWK